MQAKQCQSGIVQRDAQRRRAIKRQLRKLGIEIPPAILYNTSALRSLRRRALVQAA